MYSPNKFTFFSWNKDRHKKKVLEVDELVFSSCDIQDFFLCVHNKQP
jgi:hypothetical protein